GSAYVGDYGSGALNQTGGTIAINGANPLSGLSIGDHYGASGTVNLSAGTLSVIGSDRIGSDGAGTFNQSGGTHTANALYIAYGRNGTNPASVGSYNLSNGATLNIATTEYVGFVGSGVLNQTGGN